MGTGKLPYTDWTITAVYRNGSAPDELWIQGDKNSRIWRDAAADPIRGRIMVYNFVILRSVDMKMRKPPADFRIQSRVISKWYIANSVNVDAE